MLKKKKGKIILAVLSLSLGLLPLEAEAAVQVNPIAGMKQDFIKGADISMLPALEELGAKFYDMDGMPMDEIAVMKKYGINWVRLRIWNNPQDGPGGGGAMDAKRALATAKRAKDLGMKVLIDFHYSDWWADPGQQNAPKAWQGHTARQLEKDIYKFTRQTVESFQKANCEPDMIQIGNEVKNGMIWPVGKLNSNDDGSVFAGFMRSGLKAVRDADSDKSIKLMVHLPEGTDNQLYRHFFDQLIKQNGVNDFDIIGCSYYPFWNGSLDKLQANLNDVSARYNKDVIVVETAFGFTNDNYDATGDNVYGEAEERAGGYRSSVQGQATGLRDVMNVVNNVAGGRGLGVFYWEPDWVSVPHAGGGLDDENGWEPLAMFDKDGKALESWQVWNDVSNMNLPTIKATVKVVDDCKVSGGVGAQVTMPESTRVTYSDDHAENMSVVWEPVPIYDKAGNYEVKGVVNAINKPVKCQVKITKKVNLVQNGNFENVNLNGWQITGDSGAVNAISKAGDALGQGAMHYWSDKAFNFKVSQTFNNLKPGKYTAVVSSQGGGGQVAYSLCVTGDSGKVRKTDIKDIGWNKWQAWEIKDIEINEGKASLSIEMTGAPGNWGSIDDVEFYRQE